MLLLTTTGHEINLQAGTAGALDCHVSYMDNNAGAITPTAVDLASNAGTSLTTIVASPGSGVQRNVKNISVNNNSSSVTTTVTITHYDGTNTETLYYGLLAPNETLVMDEMGGWTHYDPTGNPYSSGLPLTTLGDILVFGTAPTRLAAGSNRQVVTYDSSSPAGVKAAYPNLTNYSTTTVSAGYAADTYLAGSAIAMPTDGPVAGTIYKCKFDMVKTAAGAAAFTLNVRYGTTGTTSDASILSLAFAVGSAAVDTGMFELDLHFRTVGSGTSAVVVASIQCSHALAATGLITTGVSGFGQVTNVSSGFNSTTAGAILGISVNGGTSFSGTNTLVETECFNLS